MRIWRLSFTHNALSGVTANQHHAQLHADAHQATGADEIVLTGLAGLSATPQTPATHATSHQDGGADGVAVAAAAANAIPKAGAGGKLAAGWLQEVLALNDLSNVSGAPNEGDYLKYTVAGGWAPAVVLPGQAYFVQAVNTSGASPYQQLYHTGINLIDAATTNAIISDRVPFTPSAIYAIYLAFAAGDVYRAVTTYWGAVGEAHNNDTDSIAAGAVACGNTLIAAENITAAFTGLISGDKFGCQYQRQGANAADTIGTDFIFMGLWVVP